MTTRKSRTRKAEIKQEKEEEPVAPPQLTFTEEEHKTLVDYQNFVASKAEFNRMKVSDNIEFNRLLRGMYLLTKKVEEHIFELVRVIERTEKK